MQFRTEGGTGRRFPARRHHCRALRARRAAEAAGDRQPAPDQHHAGARGAEAARGRRLCHRRFLSGRHCRAVRHHRLERNTQLAHPAGNAAGPRRRRACNGREHRGTADARGRFRRERSTAGDNEATRAANYRFHHRMFEIAEMPQTLHFVQILWARYPFDLINQLKGRVSRAAAEHDELLRGLITGDVSAAMLATRQHIEAGWLELRDSVQAAQSAEPGDMTVRHSGKGAVA